MVGLLRVDAQMQNTFYALVEFHRLERFDFLDRISQAKALFAQLFRFFLVSFAFNSHSSSLILHTVR
jgi:hypothetical protein